MNELKTLTTIRVGGTPKELISATTHAELLVSAKKLWSETDHWVILGGGSNIVFADDVSELSVLLVETKGIEDLGSARVRVQAGQDWNEFVLYACNQGWAGVESLAGIPGTVGAAPIQNIGAYGQEVSTVIASVEFLDYNTGELQILTKEQCSFSYRDSAFKQGKQGLITWVEFQFGKEDSTALLAKANEVIVLRQSKGMVLDTKDHDSWSCGSFFTNPIVTEKFARTIPSEAPKWEVSDDMVKLSAAWLIEHAGLTKGFSLGSSSAAISSKHALAITNRGNATAQQVVELARFIQNQVSNKFGVNLVPEPNLIGF
jgi:UDP-N-acetylmuramate dehydrogenase